MERKLKTLDKLSFSDDFIFTRVLTTNKEICKGLLERLLHIEIADIAYPEKEKIFKEGYYSRGVRLDVFVKDSDRIFDIEMQTGDFDELPLRARYYQSIIDQGTLNKGEEYRALKESYILFICTKDPIGDGKPVYTLKKTFEESDKIHNDKAHLIYYNINAFEKASDLEVKAFLQFVKTGEAKTDFTRKLMDAIDLTKITDPDLFHHYAMVQVHNHDLLRAGRKEGAHEKAVETARGMLKYGIPIDKVAEIAGLSIEEVENLNSR